MTSIVTGVASFALAPLKAVSRPFRDAFAAQLARRPGPSFSIPIIEYSQLSSLYFAIEQATQDDEGYDNPQGVPEVWLQCLIAGQFLSDRLIVDIRTVEYHMAFWRDRLRAGNNRLFLAVRLGPVRFAKAVAAAVSKLFGHAPPAQFKTSHRIEQRIVTLRTIRSALTSALARIHQAAARLRIEPEFAVGRGAEANGGGAGPTEVEDGSTARAVAAAADMFAAELLDVGQALGRLQAHLDEQEEGPASFKANSRPVLYAADSISTAPLPASPAVAALRDIPPTISRALEALLRVQAMVGGPLMRPSWRQNPIAALSAATAAAQSRHAASLRMPTFARAPSKLQRYWPLYAAQGSAALAAARFLFVHSPLAGSDDLRRWATEGYLATVRAVRDNVMAPLKHVRDEFFDTFQSRARSTAFSRADFEASKASLQRMLDDFEGDVARKDPRLRLGGANGAAPPSGMEVLMRHYEQELKAPIRNAVTGTLPRSLLIQVHKMKTDTEAAMLELDQILRANELTVAVAAALPAMAVAGLLAWGLARLLAPAAPNLRAAAAPLRVAMADLQRAVDAIVTGEEAEASEVRRREVQSLQGIVLVKIAKLRAKSAALYALSSHSIAGIGSNGAWAAEGREIETDLLEMAAEPQAAVQSRIAQRMQRAYLVFRA